MMATRKKTKAPQKKKASGKLRDVWKRLPEESAGDEMRRMIADVEYITQQDNLDRVRYTALRNLDFSLRGIATRELDADIRQERKAMLHIRRKALARRNRKSPVPGVNAEKELKTDFSAVNLVWESRVFNPGVYNISYVLDTRGIYISASEIARLPGFQMVLEACREYDIDVNLLSNARMDLAAGDRVFDDEDGGKPEQNAICDPLFAAYNAPGDYEVLMSFNLGKSFDHAKWAPYIGAPDARLVSFVVNSTTPAYALPARRKPDLRVIDGRKASGGARGKRRPAREES